MKDKRRKVNESNISCVDYPDLTLVYFRIFQCLLCIRKKKFELKQNVPLQTNFSFDSALFVRFYSLADS